MTRHLLASDHYLKPEALKTMGQKVKAGEEIAFDERLLDELRVDSAKLLREQNPVKKTMIVLSIVLLVSSAAFVLFRI